MKDILLTVLDEKQCDDDIELITECELDKIIAFDPHEEYLAEVGLCFFVERFDMHKKVDFSQLESELGIKLHPSVVEYFSCFWSPSVKIVNEKSASDSYPAPEMYMDFFKSPEAVDTLQQTIARLTSAFSDAELEGELYVPIGSKQDGWLIAVNNNTGAVALLGHDPLGIEIKAASIYDFFS